MTVHYIQSTDPAKGTREMAESILRALEAKKRVLWLVCGGSNIPFTIQALEIIRREGVADLSLLTIAQTDERYGSLDHPDSNWKQLRDKGVNLRGIVTIPILEGKPLDQTVKDYSARLAPVMEETKKSGGVIIAQFGVGADGHIAGMLPHTISVTDSHLVSGYEAGSFTRVTLTMVGLRMIDEAYTFAFGESKRKAMTDLKAGNLSLEDAPCGILRSLPKAVVYSDVFK